MTTTALDRIDIKILNELQQNASLTNVELASRVNLSPSPCLARVRTLEKLGVIDRRIAVLDPAVLGIGVTAFIQVKLERQAQPSLESFTRSIDRLSEVMECYLMTGDSDYLLRVMVSDIDALEDLIVNKLSRITGVSSIRSNLALKRISHKTVLPIDANRPVQVKSCSSASRRLDRPAKQRFDASSQAQIDGGMNLETSRIFDHGTARL
ncbi:Lrp/AsnC family leucine-responsive transcriptional regulator [Bradyrhizobium japonicum]|jgi:Lrp/AsnC family transcriptional regulator, leucine-responsive regulatory protein|uniref:Lrp/AsnC family leucine-responsive transcriptional regulator n=1 Tax=Bradyrhizobium elkanii TaxID=29448 RepID=A0ABV4FBZ8_BRAEL|nr:Lrp/AsnC family transcriptional regulator [Bradyrhizobium elkanii]MBP2431889.1 DNA-binding Lrp family transcriptional regulator [Bradyrhizobium elkanii]MCP1735039.1 DNA-binding Lrp family transcriptional regulator [Bradyrhizobium elkanii]MCP1752582.1 DNA-binding Lrp family transcriptional regulator [Bradyrhizobium elkanii]MCP1978355.1 DNA-binding Lrp family transcriptional regulator [Bradyrhizobium elkanii]MCS3570378.1 DNA-binding Lrp family transcriptional regulator [Bradyrhizobium elkanii